MSKEDILLFGTYGVRGTGKSYMEKLKEKDMEIERLHSIIKEVREELLKYENDREANRYAPIIECLEILDKEKKND